MFKMYTYCHPFVSQVCLPPPGTSLSGFSGHMIKPGQPGGDSALAIVHK